MSESLKAAEKAAKEEAKAAEKAAKLGDQEIEVGDPQELRPVELPLVVTPAKGEKWINREQAEYAKTLNGYAYKNPKKWKIKKSVLIANLVSLGKDPARLSALTGIDGNLTYKDRRIDK